MLRCCRILLCFYICIANGACQLGGPRTATGGDAAPADPGGQPGGADARRPGGDPAGADAGGKPGDPSVVCADMSAPTGIASVSECMAAGMEGKTGAPAPLVLALHGYTQTADDFKKTTQWDRLAARYGFYVVFPQTNADLVNAGGLPAAWKWWRDYSPWTRSSYNQHFAPLIAVVDAMKAEHDIDPDRIFITGLSAGGFMTTLMLAVYPDVFAAGASFSGGAADCDLQCTDSNKVQDWTRPAGYQPPGAADVINADPDYWNDPNTRKPRLMLFHGSLDEAVKPINLDDAMKQWTSALGIDAVPDNAMLGEPTTLGGYPYNAYAYNGGIGVATVLMTGLGHGTPVDPGPGVDQGGVDPIPSQTASDCSNVSDPGCEQDWTNTGAIYGPYQAARFFGLVP